MIGENVLLNKILERIKNNLTKINQEAKEGYKENNYEMNEYRFKNISEMAEQTLIEFEAKK